MNEQPKHTPGPWAFVGHGPSYARLKRQHWRVGRDADDRFGVALVFGDDDSNARLIAAAPDLLALARQYASECAECGGGGQWIELDRNGAPIPETARPCEGCADIRAVIAKAEGR